MPGPKGRSLPRFNGYLLSFQGGSCRQATWHCFFGLYELPHLIEKCPKDVVKSLFARAGTQFTMIGTSHSGLCRSNYCRGKTTLKHSMLPRDRHDGNTYRSLWGATISFSNTLSLSPSSRASAPLEVGGVLLMAVVPVWPMVNQGIAPAYQHGGEPAIIPGIDNSYSMPTPDVIGGAPGHAACVQAVKTTRAGTIIHSREAIPPQSMEGCWLVPLSPGSVASEYMRPKRKSVGPEKHVQQHPWQPPAFRGWLIDLA